MMATAQLTAVVDRRFARRVLITGCAGFIGSKVTQSLLTDGWTVVGIDSLDDSYDVRLKNWRLSRLKTNPRFLFSRVNITVREEVSRLGAFLMQDSLDAIIHMAARTGVRQSVENPSIYMETNALGTLHMLDLCKKHKIRKFVFASTSSVYSSVNCVPYSEEECTDRIQSPYAVSKKASELLCHTYHALFGIDATILRYFTVFGDAGRPDMLLWQLVKKIHEQEPVEIYGDGNQSRDFTHVDDIVRGTVSGLRDLGCEVINLGSSRPISVLDAVRSVERATGRQATINWLPANPADSRITWANIEKAKRILAWSPQVTFEEGIERAVLWYVANRHWARDIRS